MAMIEMKIHKSRILVQVLTAIVSILILSPPAWAMTVDELGNPTGWVNDYTNTLSGSDEARLTAICEELERANTAELAIVIIDTLEGRSVEDYAQDLFETWGIGKEGADNGVLILMAMMDREWRVHTGYGVEGTLTDSLAMRIMENEAVPEFRDGNFGQGLINAATQIKLVLEGESYSTFKPTTLIGIFLPFVVIIIAGFLIFLGVRIKCPRCGSKVRMTRDKEILESTYSHSGIRKKDYECTVCHHQFSRMLVIPMLVKASSSSSRWGSGGWSSSSSSGWSSGGSSFGGFGGGSSGGGGASGGW
jgi:uncharacterized protein